jgi:hypothetical protein
MLQLSFRETVAEGASTLPAAVRTNRHDVLDFFRIEKRRMDKPFSLPRRHGLYTKSAVNAA